MSISAPFSPPFSLIDQEAILTIRTLSIDAIEKANSGHPGLPLGAAPMAYVLWQYHLKHNPKDPKWADRDRFVLSPGHGSMLLYSLLHLSGYALSIEEIKNFRQWGSLTPGHPEYHLTPGVECTSGPLGQGSVNAVGMAIAERSLANLLNRPGYELINHYTYALVSDGDLMEGVSAEAGSLAGHLKLGKLIYLYDDNQVTLDGPTSMTFSTESVAARYTSYGWQVLEVKNGNTDLNAIHEAITLARKETTKPSLIIVKTTIGYGSPNKQGKSSVHGSPLGKDEAALTKKTLGWIHEQPFFVPETTRSHFQKKMEQGIKENAAWNTKLDAYEKEFPELAKIFRTTLPTDWEKDVPSFSPKDAEATRTASGKVLNALAKRLPWIIGGDADLGVSTNTVLKDMGSFDGQTGKGRNIHFGVREHAMASIANGIAYHGGLLPFTATFFCFSDYMRPALRLAAMGNLPAVHVWTHDSIGLGEDGPTHQPIEHLAAIRCIPGFVLLRPCDANETAEAWKFAVSYGKGPVGIVLTRQKLPVIDRAALNTAGSEKGLHQGGYILADSKTKLQLILISTGSEVHLCLEAQKKLQEKGIGTRVVSLPSWELFERQSAAYREKVLPSAISARLAVEAGSALGWHKWVGDRGEVLALDHFGASAPAEILFEKMGFSGAQVAARAEKLLNC